MALDDDLTLNSILLRREGTFVATAQLSLEANKHRAVFLDELEGDPAVDFSLFAGKLIVEANREFVALLLRQGEGEIATLPAVTLKKAVELLE